MLELLAGAGLSTAAGLNAALPLLVLGALDRWTGLVDLPDAWSWLSDPWVLAILGVLLLVEVVADKVPGADHVNDVLQTLVRPTAGGLAFGAGAGSRTAAVTDPASFFTTDAWVPVAIGVLLALGVHVAKATTRAVVNAATLGVGGPVLSAAEDVTSLVLSVAAIIVPVLVVAVLGLMVWFVARAFRRRRAARTGGRDVRSAPSEGTGT